MHSHPPPAISDPSFFFNDPATTEIYTLSLHDALPISIVFDGSLAGWGILENALTIDVRDRKSTRLNSSHVSSSYAVFCLKKKKDILEVSPVGQKFTVAGVSKRQYGQL